MVVLSVTQSVEQINRTMERQKLLELAGYTVDTMWECDWHTFKNTLPNKPAIEQKTLKQNIQTRDALCGGRTEAIKPYVKSNKHQKICYSDVCYLYPTVNVFDDYAVGYLNVDITFGLLMLLHNNNNTIYIYIMLDYIDRKPN